MKNELAQHRSILFCSWNNEMFHTFCHIEKWWLVFFCNATTIGNVAADRYFDLIVKPTSVGTGN